MKTVLLGLSGGVDSTLAALLLKKQGYEVIGLFMRTYREYSKEKNPCKSKTSQTDENMAKLAAKTLKIELIIKDYKKEYRKGVIKPMIRDYKRGLTPNPDIICNKLIKFPYLLREAKKIGADYIATGHYARIKKTKRGNQLLKAIDNKKDQSYFLYELDQNTLSKTLFPIGALKKDQVRKLAKRYKLPNWDKPGTRGICFLGKTPNIKSFLEKKIKKKRGRILSPENKLLGHHLGASYYTIGQKIQDSLGLKINKPKEHAQERYYIAKKRENTLIAAPENHPALKKRKVVLSKLHKIDPEETLPKILHARIRHLGNLHRGTLKKRHNRHIFVFSRPIEALAEGQALVLYKNNQLVAGGEIRLK